MVLFAVALIDGFVLGPAAVVWSTVQIACGLGRIPTIGVPVRHRGIKCGRYDGSVLKIGWDEECGRTDWIRAQEKAGFKNVKGERCATPILAGGRKFSLV